MLVAMMKTGLILSTLSSTALAAGQIAKRQVTPTGDICRLWDHRSAMIDDWIFVDYALATWTDDAASNMMYYSLPFGVKLDEIFDTQNIGSDNPIYIEIAENLDVPITTKGVVWADKDKDVYKYGGVYPLQAFWGNNTSYDPRGPDIWKLDTTTYNWTKLPAAAGDTVFGTRNAGVAYVPELGLGFAAGGHESNQTDVAFGSWQDGHAQLLNSMVTYSMGNNTWKNQTTPMDPFTLSSLVHVPIGSQGLLVSLGGYGLPGSGYWDPNDSSLVSRDLDTIDIYDVERQTWSTQRTTGSTPRNRLSFCTVVAVAADQSSYNLILHGGSSNEEYLNFADTYILSLPSFQWIKIDDGVKGMERQDHTCHLSQNKMIVIGGKNVDQENPKVNPLPKNGNCEPTSFINIFDVNTLKWETKWDPAARAQFKVPAPVVEVIGGDGLGCAVSRDPEAGWESARIRSLFSNYTAASDCAERSSKSRVTSTSTSASPTSTSEAGSGSMVTPQDSIFYLGLLSLVAFVPFL